MQDSHRNVKADPAGESEALPNCIVLFAASLSSAVAGPADEIVAEAARFCADTPIGRSYASLEACMNYQKDGAQLLSRAIQSGYGAVVTNCITDAQYEGVTDFAAAGLCAATQSPELAR